MHDINLVLHVCKSYAIKIGFSYKMQHNTTLWKDNCSFIYITVIVGNNFNGFIVFLSRQLIRYILLITLEKFHILIMNMRKISLESLQQLSALTFYICHIFFLFMMINQLYHDRSYASLILLSIKYNRYSRWSPYRFFPKNILIQTSYGSINTNIFDFHSTFFNTHF